MTSRKRPIGTLSQAATADLRVSALPGLREPYTLPTLTARIIELAPEHVMTAALVDCRCGFEHVFRTRQLDRLMAGVMTRRCKVDRQRYRLVAKTRRVVRRAA